MTKGGFVFLVVALTIAVATTLSFRGRPAGESALYGFGLGFTVLGGALLLTDSSADPGGFMIAAVMAVGFASLAETIRRKH